MPAAREPVGRIASAPASSANLGPGFDCLAVALDLKVEVSVEPATELRLTSQGEGADLPLDTQHLAARVVREVLGHDRVAVHVRSNIPVARGLGSSAALAVATAAAAGADDPFAVAARLDGHPENAAASAMGGLVAATTLDDGGPYAVSLPLDEAIAFVVLIPERALPTAAARAVLPEKVRHDDAAFNLGRVGLLIGAFADLDRFRPGLMSDRLHQPYRRALMPEADALIAGLEERGALGAAWSGAGPSILAVCRRQDAPLLQAHAAKLLHACDLEGDARILTPDMRGLYLAEA